MIGGLFQYNYVMGNGGALNINNFPCVFINFSIFNNRALNLGGGIYLNMQQDGLRDL